MSDAKDAVKSPAVESKESTAEAAPTQDAAASAAPKKRAKKKSSDKAPISQATPPIIRRKKSAAPSPEAASEAPAETAEAPEKQSPPAAAEAAPDKKDAPDKKEADSPAPEKEAASAPEGTEVASGEQVSPNVKAAARMGPAARLAAEAAAKRAERGESPVPAAEASSEEITVSAADLDAAIEGAEAPRRRARKRRAVRTETPDVAETAAGDEGGEAKEGASEDAKPRTRSEDDRPRRNRGRGEAGGEGRRERGRRDAGGEGRRDRGNRDRGKRDGGRRDAGNGVAAVGQTTRSRIYQQDVAPHIAAARAEAERKAAEAERLRTEKNAQDKITLILHPAPKASMAGKKKSKDRPKTAKEALKAKTSTKSKASKPRKDAGKDAAAADVKLESAWLAADAGSAAEALSAAGAGAPALVKAWLDASNASALARAAQLDSVGGKTRKAARRALNVLKSRGVEIPKLESASTVATETMEETVAMFIPPDASGATFFSISQRQRGGRYHVVDIVLRSRLGVVHANSAKLAGKHIKGWLGRVEKQYGAKPVQVPIDWARHLIAVGRKMNDESRQLVPLGFDSCAPLLEPTPDDAPAHPLADLLSEDSSKADVEQAIGDSDGLHREPEFAGWMPDRPALDELLAKVGERVGADGVKDPDVVDEAIRAEVAAATDRWFTPERRTALADSMHDCAISLRSRRGDDTARRVVAVARAVREAGLITSPPSEIPFLLHFFQKAVAYLVQQNQGQLRVPIPAAQP